MNKQQVQTTVGMVLAIVGSVGVSTNKFTPEQWAGLNAQATTVINSGLDAVYGLAALVGSIMTWWASREKGQAQAVETIPGVQLHVDPSTAPASLVDMALDPAHKDVVLMTGPGGQATPVQK